MAAGTVYYNNQGFVPQTYAQQPYPIPQQQYPFPQQQYTNPPPSYSQTAANDMRN